jgi:hypothetical protein
MIVLLAQNLEQPVAKVERSKIASAFYAGCARSQLPVSLIISANGLSLLSRILAE